jgi:hypothetical protein
VRNGVPGAQIQLNKHLTNKSGHQTDKLHPDHMYKHFPEHTQLFQLAFIKYECVQHCIHQISMSHEPHTERTNKHLLCLTKQFRSLGNGATHEPPLACPRSRSQTLAANGFPEISWDTYGGNPSNSFSQSVTAQPVPHGNREDGLHRSRVNDVR